MEQQKPIEYRAIHAAGGPKAVSEKTGFNIETIKRWAKGNPIAADAVYPICRAAGGTFQPYELRPDIFDKRHQVEVTV